MATSVIYYGGLADISPSEWFDVGATRLFSSDTVAVYLNPDGTRVTLTGTGFSYDGSGGVTGGYVDQITLSDSSGATIYARMSGIGFISLDFVVNQWFTHGAQGGQYVFNYLVSGADTTYGGDAGDYITASGYTERVYSGGGGDLIVRAQSYGGDTIYGDGGSDTIDYGTSIFFNPLGSVTIDLGAGYAEWSVGYDYLSSVENAVGSAFGDRIDDSAGDNVMSGGGGADTIHATTGADVLNGDAGNDVLVKYGSGSATMNGGADSDLLLAVVAQATMNGGSGDDTLYAGSGAVVADGGSGLNRFYGGEGNDLYRAAEGQDTAYGGGGVDTIDLSSTAGGVFVDMAAGYAVTPAGTTYFSEFEAVVGTTFADRIYGDSGANLIQPGDGADTVYGGGGADTIDFTTASAGLVIDFDGCIAIHNFSTGGPYYATFFIDFDAARGSNFADVFQGSANSEWLDGAGGDDTMLGGGGADTIAGGAGHNMVFGGDGADRLISGADVDPTRSTAFSCEGTETGGVDTIAGARFGGVDAILLNEAGFGNLAVGALTQGDPLTGVGDFYSGTGSTDAIFGVHATAGFAYDTSTRTLYYDADGSGAASSAVAILTIENATTLVASDLIVFSDVLII